MTYTFKQKIGAAMIDWPRCEWHVRGIDLPGLPSGHWTRVRNRRDRLRIGPGGVGVDVAGRWTSQIHVTNVFPSLGTRLMRVALDEWPIKTTSSWNDSSGKPAVTFLIGHKGTTRLPHLLLVLETVAAQRDVDVECVVVEQSRRPELGEVLPGWVRLVRNPPPVEGMPYSRSWAFNVGARVARGRVLVFHDGDMLIPTDYGREVCRLHEEGWKMINLKRLVFYLSRRETECFLAESSPPAETRPGYVLQNLEGGGSLAVDRESYLTIGGFDEEFVGWGGEDNEFWERASRVLRTWPYGYVPLVHLWHPSQPEKRVRERDTARLLEERSRIPAEQRVAELSARDFGRPEKLDPAWSE